MQYPDHIGILIALCFAGVVLLTGTTGGDRTDPARGRMSPEAESFLREVRKRLRSDQDILRHYIYRRTVTEYEVGGDGEARVTRTRAYDVHPVPGDPEGMRWLVMQDGTLVPQTDIARLEAEYRARIERERSRLARETPRERERRLAREAEKAHEENESVEDVMRIFVAEVGRSTVVNGVPSRLVTFSPRPDAAPRTRAGRFLLSVAGRAWFSEAEYELVRVEAEMIAPVRYGWGLLATIHKGSTAVIERRRTADGRWLPHRYEFVGSGRLLLVKSIQRRTTVTLSEFRPAPPEAVAQ